jgi:Ca-activated chloride channel family protein
MTPDPNINPSFEAEMRAVPLPAGLLARLRAVALADDAGLDAALRHVPVPAGLASRLRCVVAADDDSLDAALQDVPVPADLCGKLRQAVWTDDEGLDATLRNVPIPMRIASRLRRVAKRPHAALPRFARWATAVSLLVAVAATFLGALFGLLLVFAPVDDLRLVERIPSGEDATGASTGELFVSPLAAMELPQGPDAFPPSALPAPEIPLDPPAGDEAPRWSQLADVWSQFERAGQADPFFDVRPYQWPDVLGSREYDLLPELKKVAGPQPQGVKPPLVPPFDLRYYIKYRMFPFVPPAGHPKLLTSVVPLGVDTASYDLTRRYLEDGQTPPSDAIRTEEFLQAVDYKYPAPTKQPLGVTVAAGPSPFGGEGLTLLQIGVQGRQFRDDKRTPVHLVLTVDVSASMRQGGRLDMLPQAVDKLLRRLGPADRVSLIVFSDQSRVVLEDVGRENGDAVRQAVAALEAEKSTNVSAALRLAYTVARQHAAPGKLATLVVLLTDGTAEVEQAAAAMIQQRLGDARPRDIRLEVVDLGQSPQSSPQLERFAQAGGGKVRRAANPDQICWALLEAMTGKSQMVAADVRLSVTFNPNTVLEYRLLGHEPGALAGMLPGRVETDFFAGQSATALYEVRLAGGNAQDIAAVELQWLSLTGGTQQIVRKVARKEFAAVFTQAPQSLQAAALVAQTAEILRRHPRTLRTPRPLAAVLELAKQVPSDLYQRPSFAEFLSVVEHAESGKPRRGGPRR